MEDKIIIDADICIKLGGSDKYRFLYDILPLISNEIYMHTHAHGEVMMPSSAVSQLKDLISEGKVVLVNESELQPIIDTQLNTGIDDISCIRIVDIVMKAKNGEIVVPRKVAKALWVVARKSKERFDSEIWPVE